MKASIFYLLKIWATTAAIAPFAFVIKEFIKSKSIDVGALVFIYISTAAFAFLFSIPCLIIGIIVVWTLAKFNLNITTIKLLLSFLTIPACYFPLKVILYGDNKHAVLNFQTFMSIAIVFIVVAIFAIWKYPLHVK